MCCSLAAVSSRGQAPVVAMSVGCMWIGLLMEMMREGEIERDKERERKGKIAG